MNVAKVGKAACKSRMVSKALAARQRRATAGVTGEDGRMIVRQLKTVLDIPVWKSSPKGSVDRARMVFTGRLGVFAMNTWPPGLETAGHPLNQG